VVSSGFGMGYPRISFLCAGIIKGMPARNAGLNGEITIIYPPHLTVNVPMAIMKIRGGDLDLVEYEFKAFAPGKNLKTLGLEKIKYQLNRRPGPYMCRPGPDYLTVLDMNRFAPDHPGGGGIGFAIHCYCTAEVSCTKKEIVVDYNRAQIVENLWRSPESRWVYRRFPDKSHGP